VFIITGLTIYPVMAEPSVSISPTCGAEQPGFDIVMDANGFKPNSKVAVNFLSSDGEIPLYTSFDTNSTGGFNDVFFADDLKAAHYKLVFANDVNNDGIIVKGAKTVTRDVTIPCPLPTQSNNATAFNSETEQMQLRAEMKPSSNQFLGEGYFDIKKFDFIPSNGSEICPTNNCKYTVENGQLSPNSFSGGYTFEGRLKVTTQEQDVKKSKFYNFNVDLDKTSEEERNGETIQSLEGTFGLGKDRYNPEISYDITNATLKVDEKYPILTIQGERF